MSCKTNGYIMKFYVFSGCIFEQSEYCNMNASLYDFFRILIAKSKYWVDDKKSKNVREFFTFHTLYKWDEEHKRKTIGDERYKYSM